MHKIELLSGTQEYYLVCSLEFQMQPVFLEMNSVRALGSIAASLFAFTRLSDSAPPDDKWCLYGKVITAQGTRYIKVC